jgi:hypothetical protein
MYRRSVWNACKSLASARACCRLTNPLGSRHAVVVRETAQGANLAKNRSAPATSWHQTTILGGAPSFPMSTAQRPYTGRTLNEPDVRAVCTRTRRGCPAGLPGRAKSAAQPVPDLTPPSRSIRGGEVRNSSKARPVRPAGQTPKSKSKSNPETVSSACGLHLPRCARHTTAQASGQPARNIR